MDNLLIFGVTAIITIVALVKNLHRWSLVLQQYMAREAKRLFGSSLGWERPWMANVARAMIVLWGFVIIMGAYALLFGEIRVE
jgi:hypothetical protein